MISKEVSATLGFAVREAKRRRHEYVSVEHVLFAILHDAEGSEIVQNCGGDPDEMLAHLARDVRKQFVPVLQFHAVHGRREYLDDRAGRLDCITSGHGFSYKRRKT